MYKVPVVIYSRPKCHLCDEAKEAILAADCNELIDLQIVNIERDAELLARYTNDVPVITIDGEEAFRHRVDSRQFRDAISKKSGGRESGVVSRLR